jgi:Transposase DDE domain group 1
VVKEGTLRVQATNSPSSFEVTTDGTGVVGHAGAALLRELADRVGLTAALGWRDPQGRRHPDAAVLRDLAVMLADGGDCLSDLAVLRDQPALFGPVASTPTAWRVVERTASDPDGLARLRAARAHARARAWAAGGHPDVELLIVDADATLVLAHTDAKEGAAGTYKHTFGFAPLLAYLERGPAPGEPLAGLLRPGNAPAGATTDLAELVDLAVAQLPAAARTTKPVLVRSDSAGGSSKLAWHLRERGIGFTLGMQIDAHVREAILAQPEHAWTPAVEPDGQVRDGAEACELTGWIDLHTWPAGTRAICRREDAHPGAQLRFTDHDGHRFQVFLTDQPDPDLARLELRHRQRARIEDRIRAAKATGLANLPFDRWRRNAVWLELVLAAQDLCCWTQALLLAGPLARAEPKTLRYRLLHVAARIVRHARRLILRLQASWPWAVELARAFARLRALPLRC